MIVKLLEQSVNQFISSILKLKSQIMVELDELIFEQTNGNITVNQRIFDFEKELQLLSSEISQKQHELLAAEDRQFELHCAQFHDKLSAVVQEIQSLQNNDFQLFNCTKDKDYLYNSFNGFIGNLHQIEQNINSQIKQMNTANFNCNVFQDLAHILKNQSSLKQININNGFFLVIIWG